MRLNTPRQVATIWSDADQPSAIERLECEIHLVIHAKPKVFNKLFQDQERQLLREVGTTATGPRSTVAKIHAHMTSPADEESNKAVNMNADKRVQCLVRPSDVETEATTWRIADADRVVNQLEREIYGITSKGQIPVKKEFSIRVVDFEAWWQEINIQELQKAIEQRRLHFG